MNIWKLLKRNFLYPLLALFIGIIWLISTESGLKTSFWLIKPFLDGKISAREIHGKWIHTIKITDLNIETRSIKITTGELVIKPLISKLLYSNIHLSSFSILNAVIEVKNPTLAPILINHSGGELSLHRNKQAIFLQLNTLEGTWLDTSFHAEARLHIQANSIEDCNAFLDFGRNQLKIMRSEAKNTLDWILDIKQTDNLHAYFQGLIVAQTLKTWVGEITTAHINSPIVGKWNLKTPCPFSLESNRVSFGLLQLHQSPDALVTAFAQWDKKVGLNAEIQVPPLTLHHPNFQGKAAFHASIDQRANRPPLVKGQLSFLPGKMLVQLSEKKQIAYLYQGGNLNFSYNEGGIDAVFSFKENAYNSIQAFLKSVNDPIAASPKQRSDKNSISDWLNQNITGSLTVKWMDLSRIYSFVPGVAKVKGSLEILGKIAGTPRQPLLSLEADIKKVAFLIPKQGIQIRNLDCKIKGDLHDQFILDGTGLAGDGFFTIKGTSYLSKDPKATLELEGKDLQIYNTANIQIMASPAVNLNYANHTFFLQGSVQIPEAYIFIRDNKNYATPSKDVVVVNSEDKEVPATFKVVPSLYVRIENRLHFKGYGLDGIIGGKLAIDQRPDGLLSGTGRLTIKEGKYRLQGATRYIHQGHLLFPPGTLLSDPILDILISQKRVGEQREGADVGIYVQGTLQNPLPHLYSSAPLQSTDILSRMGLGSAEMTGTENQRQVLTQTAFLLSGNANPFIDLLQSNLGLEEFSLESRETNKVSTQGGSDTVFVIGRSLSKNLYLQCLQNVMEPVTTVKLKYFLGPYFSTSIETGTEGLGGDITFSLEKD